MALAAAALAGGLSRTGQAALYGVNLNTGKAAVKPESEAALKALARLLQQPPRLMLHVPAPLSQRCPSFLRAVAPDASVPPFPAASHRTPTKRTRQIPWALSLQPVVSCRDSGQPNRQFVSRIKSHLGRRPERL